MYTKQWAGAHRKNWRQFEPLIRRWAPGLDPQRRELANLNYFRGILQHLAVACGLDAISVAVHPIMDKSSRLVDAKAGLR